MRREALKSLRYELNAKQRNYVVCFHFGETKDCYAMMLDAVAVSRRNWVTEEHLSGRINEKQLAEALLISSIK